MGLEDGVQLIHIGLAGVRGELGGKLSTAFEICPAQRQFGPEHH
jgi:hypothetical protein